jgi:hypothetical protein
MFKQTYKLHVLSGYFCWTQNVVCCLSFQCPCCGCPTTLTTYVSKALNRNICMLMKDYRAMRKWSRNGITPIKGKSVVSYWIYRPWRVTIQIWSYMIEICRVNQWLPMLNDITNICLSLQCFITLTKYVTTSTKGFIPVGALRMKPVGAMRGFIPLEGATP